MKLFLILSLIAFNINIYSQDYYEDRLFIKLKNEYQDNLDLTKDKSINFILSKYDKAKFQKAFRSNEMRSVYEVQFKDKVDLTRLIAQLEKYEYIEYAEKIPIYKLFYTPNDPQYSSQWNLAKIQADLAWNLSQGCSGIKVAITDDGFLMNHEDLVNQWYINSVEIPGNGVDEDGNGYIDDWRGWDAANNDNDPSAFNPSNTYFTHGTHVAGIVGAATNNSKGIASIGFNNKLIPIKIGRDIDGALAGPYQGLDYAINATTCDVINMSWGGGAFSTTYQILFNLAYSKGIICVAAAGNSNLNTAITPMYPAAYNHVISVAASTSTDAKAGFSNYGTNIDVTAPGANILSCLAGGISSYGNLSGTSMASPLVAGLCGLMKCYNPMPVDSVEACLKRTCDNINAQNPSYVGQLGAGRINAFQALQCLTQKPVSDFYAKDTQQCIGKPVRYFATSFGIPTLTYSWSFPGGSPPTSTFKNPQVTYAANGTYSATLTTTNGVGAHTVTKTNIVTIGAPKASLIGRKYTSYNSNAVIVTVKFTGNPPFNVTLTDGTNNFTQNNITANPYYFSIVPLKDTSYISISSFQDTQCVGTKLGQDTIYKITLGSGSTSYCESSFKFNGTSNNVVKIDKYNGANWKDLYSTNGYTWECWFNLGNRSGASVTGLESLVAASDAVLCEDLGLHFNWPAAGGGKLNWVISGQGGCNGSVPRGVISTNMTFNANTWYHAAGVMDYSTNTVLLYVNGQQVASGTITIPLALRMQNNVAVTIGNQDVNFNPYTSFSPFNGKIDEVRFWNSVRTPAEIQANYKTCLPATTSNLVAYFKGDEGAGTSTVSKINGNFVGTLQNSASWDVQVDSVKNCTICTNTSDCDTSNLIINGNFDSGNTGFYTDYTYCNTAGCLFPLAFNGYAINQNASIPHSSFQGLGHGGTGNFAIYNGGLNTLRAWEQTISVTPNKNYKYSFWVNTIYTTNTANLGFYINDVLLQTINAPSTLNTWVNLSGVWNSGLITNPKLTIRCTNTSLSSANNGMDFGIDDITFNKVCISDCDTTNLNTGLVLNLPFNGNTLDISGKGNHATNFGATLVAGKAGIPNTAYRFDSTNFMSVAHNATLNLRSFTLTAIVKPLKFNTDVCFTNNIINKGTASTGAQWAMQYAPTTSTTCFNRDTSECNMFLCGSVCPSSNSITNTQPYMVHNKWECAVLTYDSVTKDVKMYMNGVLRHQWNATFNSLFSQNTANVFIGKYNDPTYPGYLQGIIDDIRVYNRVLAPSEVKGYCGTCTVVHPPSDCDTTNLNTGLVLNLPFNGNTNDISGNGNHATNFGATPVTGKNGIANNAYRFNGTSNFMQITNSSSLNNISTITMTAILKPKGFYTGACFGNAIIQKGVPDGVIGNFALRYSPMNSGGCNSSQDPNQNNFYAGFSTGGCSVSQIYSSPYVKQDSWYCVVSTYNGDSLKTYINGYLRLACKPAIPIGSNTQDVFIGKLNSSTYPYWLNAEVDDLRIYNRVLAPSEVKGYCGTCNQDTVCKSVNNTSCWVKDAAVSTYTPNTNYSAHPECLSASWTCGGSPCQARSYFDFNLSQIPTNAVIESAKLYLYAVPNSANNGYTGQPTYGTNNASVIQRVIQSWDENTITWTNKPNTTAVNQATLSQSTGLLQNYVVDMKNLIIDHRANITSSYGFMLKHIAEGTNMNSMIFGSTDNPNPALRPRLDICYSVPSGSPIYASPPSECDSNSCDTTNLNTGLVLNLPFNGNTNDVSGNGNHATNNGATPVTGKNGIANNAYRFNGTSNFMQITNSSSLNNISTITMTAILKPKGFYTGACFGNAIIQKGVPDGVVGNFALRYSPLNSGGCNSSQDPNQNNFYAGFSTGGCSVSQIYSSPYVKQDSWYCVVSTYNGDSLKTYINGYLRLACKPAIPIGSNTQDVFIGKLNSATYPYWLNAEVDDIRIYNRVLAPSEVKGYCGTCTVVPPPIPCDTSGLVLCMSMDGHTQDSTKYNHHGINRGASLTSDRFGVINKAYSFNGTSNYINLGTSSILKPNQATISFRMKINALSSAGFGYNLNPLLVTGNTNTPGNLCEAYFLGISTNGNSKFHSSSWNPITSISSGGFSNQSFNLNTWYHYSVTNSNDSIKIYINGQLDKSYYKGFSTNYLPTDSIIIGYSGNNTNNQRWFNGVIDDIKMYNRVLSATEVSDLYSKPFSCSCNTTVLPPSKPCDTARKFVFLKCTNDILQLNARQGSNYQWSPTTGLSSDTIRNPNCSVKSTTTYLVLYTDTNGCQLIDTVNVMVKKAAFYSPLDDQLICNGDSVQLTIPVKATGINWSPNTGISNVNSKSPYFYPSTTTTYYLQFIDSLGCLQFDTIVVNVKQCCASRARFKLSNNLVCFGSNIFITNTSKNSTSYNWSFPNATPSSFIGANPPALSFPTGNSYPIRLIVSNGICFDTMIQSVSVVQVKPNAGKDTATCLANLTVNIGETSISDWSYKWTPTTYLNDATISDPLCTMINDSINYILEVTDRSSGCKGYDTVQVKTNQKVDSIVASAIICQGDSILFNSIYRKTSGKYFYTIKKLNSICDSFINIQYVKVLLPTSIIQSPEPYCNFYIDKKGKRHDTSYTRRDTIKYKSLITCDSLILSTRVNIFKTKYDSLTKIACKEVIYNGKKYLTSKRKIDSTIIRGPYSGCDSIITHIHAVIKPIPNAQITASKPNLLNYGDTVTLTASGGFTYLWSPTNSTNTSIVHISEDTIYHTYIVTVTDTNLCWDTAMYRVKGRFPDTLYYGIPNIFSPNGDGRNDIFIPNMNYGVKILEFYIWNRWGEKMWESHDNHGWDGFYKNKPAPASVYVYYVMFQTPWGKREYKGSFTLIR